MIDAPTPPADRLLGKSPEWVNAYTEAYQKSMRGLSVKSSAMGCLFGGMVLSAMVYRVLPASHHELMRSRESLALFYLYRFHSLRNSAAEKNTFYEEYSIRFGITKEKNQ